MIVKREKNDCCACLKEPGTKTSEGKQMYISKKTHYGISVIVRPLENGEVMVTDFTENVVREYLRIHHDGLNRMLNAVPRVEL